MNNKKKRNTYSEEFKLEAVKLANSIGQKEAAKELDVSLSSIKIWIQKLDDSSGTPKDYDELLKKYNKLQKEMGYVEEINRVLKKSVGIFSSDQKTGSK